MLPLERTNLDFIFRLRKTKEMDSTLKKFKFFFYPKSNSSFLEIQSLSLCSNF